MLRIAIAEDQALERSRLAGYVRTYAQKNILEISLHIYTNGQDLTNAYKAGVTEDLILLDIDMEKMDGISAARKIRETDEQVQIVFVTRMVQHALEGYEVAAADFIVKPVPYELFAAKIDRVLRRISPPGTAPISLKAAQGQFFLRPDDIAYAESSGKHVRVHLITPRQGYDELDVSVPLYQLEKQLPEQDFFRCHSAFLISLRAVTGVSQTDVYLGETRIPLSKHRRKEFVLVLSAFHMNRL